MSANTVYVKNISSATSKKEVTDFFSFCGKVKSIEITPNGDTQNAEVVFEKETAAKTALLLDNTQLGKTQVSVTGAEGAKEFDEAHGHKDTDEITQEEKPRSRIIAEYLAHGYIIGDQASQRALDLDHKHGISSRFLQTLHDLDNKYKATEKAKSADQSYGISSKAQGLFQGLASYYEKAAETPTGQKVVQFYTQTQKQVEDIHREARRLADLKKEETAAAAPDAQSPASQRRQFPAPIRPPARAAATTKPAPAKSGNAPALRARSRRGKTQPPRRQLVTVVAIPRIARVLRATGSTTSTSQTATLDSTKIQPLDDSTAKQ
ncbi:Protein vip1 [Pseudogymnoascus australis]